MNAQTKQKLLGLQLAANKLGLHGSAPDGSDWKTYLDTFCEGTLKREPASEVEQNKELGKLFHRAHMRDPEAMTQLNELIVTTTQNFIVPQLMFGRFFKIVNLGEKDSPGIVNTTRQEIGVSYISQDNGKADEIKVLKPRQTALVDLYEIISDRVTWVTRDIYTGNITAAAEVMFDIAEAIALKIEAILHPEGGALQSAFGAFDVTNANKAARVHNAHSMIKSGILPTTNELSISGITGATKFGYSVMDAALDYCARYNGSNVRDNEGAGPLMPTGEIIVRADEAREIEDGITVTGNKGTPVSEQILERGWMDLGSYKGVDVKLIPCSTISSKKCYPVLNRPVGNLYFKPSMDDVDEEVEKLKNLAHRQEKKVIGTAIPTPNLRNVCRVAYRT